MHGFMTPAEVQAAPSLSPGERLARFARRNKWFLLVVVAPTLLLATYLYALASNQYVSEAHFLVRTQGGTTAAPASGIGAALGLGGAAGGAASGEAQSVSDYLTSHDVVDTLQKRLDLVKLFRRPEADIGSRLPMESPTPEYLLRYYQKQVDVYYDTDTGITTLKARAFRPDDAYRLTSTLLMLGEQRVNEINIRGFADAVALSRRQLDEAERALGQVQTQMTRFRQSERDVDPAGTAQAQIALVSRLSQELSAARAQLATTQALIGGASPQVEALQQQIRSLERQLAAQNGRLTGGSSTIAAGLGGYERLRIQQELLAKRYEAASASYEAARQNAVRQQLYVARIVEPNRPVKSLYPKRALTLLTVFCGLLVVYAIGWLIAAGVREHAA
ncbi:lipopolysaccharide biosynthesis protein [Sphingomonas sp. NBWT7]|uniref:lipopolysaccharide biosynthesis protein n=1 Tax=Sphingomonas sp. NBWT7 TaxID=2596913 RepID=UPI0021562DC2|nr:lipopolysaccharide biosynthesis protein [Sphingomonas sp. NBWT7]